MKLLAYDTSGATLTVALFRDGQKMNEIESAPGVRHSSVLLPMIEQILKKHSLEIDGIDILAVGVGPGSFTGLRVGIATAKILGYVLKKKIIGVCGLEGMAIERIDQGETCVAAMMNARKGQVYGAIYEKKRGYIKTVSAPALWLEEKFLARARNVAVVTAQEISPSASNIAQTIFSSAAAHKFIDPYRLQPLYLHPRDCNVTLPKK